MAEPAHERPRFRWPFRRSHLPWCRAIVEKFPDYSDVMSRLVRRDIRRYRRFGRAHMVWFRLSGVIEIVLSVTFPFVVEISSNTVVVTGVSVSIALAGALSAFYSWNDNWQLYKTQHLIVRTIVGRWELRMLQLVPDAEAQMQEAHEATEKALAEYASAIENEHNSYFGNVTAPRELMEGNLGNGAPVTPGAG